MGRPIKDKKTEQRDGGPHEHEDDVFPRGFQRLVRVFETDQQHAEDGGELDGNPVEIWFDDDRDRRQGENEQIEMPIVGADAPGIVAVMVLDVTDREQGRNERRPADGQEDQRAESVQGEPAGKRDDGGSSNDPERIADCQGGQQQATDEGGD
jgi:hypothetical protein